VPYQTEEKSVADAAQIYRLLHPIAQTNQHNDYLTSVYKRMVKEIGKEEWTSDEFDLRTSRFLQYFNRFGKCFYFEKMEEGKWRGRAIKGDYRPWPILKTQLDRYLRDIIAANKEKPWRLASLLTLHLNNKLKLNEHIDRKIQQDLLFKHLLDSDEFIGSLEQGVYPLAH
jgi:hypothetical protein